MPRNEVLDVGQNGHALTALPDREARPRTKHHQFSVEYKNPSR